MMPISNKASKEALTHTGLMLATVYAGWLMEGPPLKSAELAVAVALAFLVLAIDAWGACAGWWNRRAGMLCARREHALESPMPIMRLSSPTSRDATEVGNGEDPETPPGTS